MLLDPYTPVFIIGVMVTCIVVVGLIGLLFGALGLLTSSFRSTLRLGLYGSYTGAIPGGIIGYAISTGSEMPLAGFLYALGGGVVGALFGAIAGVGWLFIGQRYRAGIRRRLGNLWGKAPSPPVSQPPQNPSEPGGQDQFGQD